MAYWDGEWVATWLDGHSSTYGGESERTHSVNALYRDKVSPEGLTVFPALSNPRKRILAFLCKRPMGDVPPVNSPHSTRHGILRMHTELGENVPKPVDDEHVHEGTKRRIERLRQRSIE